jgi:LacI family transcriptional regulator
VVLIHPETAFFMRLNRAFIHIARMYGHDITVFRTFIDDSDPSRIACHIEKTKADGLIVFSQAHQDVHEAIARVTRRGIAVVTVGSDLPDSMRFAYVGIDNYRAGRTAAALMATMLRGRASNVILATHALPYVAHELRVKGFIDGAIENKADFSVQHVLKSRNTKELSALLLETLKTSKQDIDGFYNTTAWDMHLCQTVRSCLKPKSIPMLGHELTSTTVDFLKEGYLTLVLDQRAEMQAWRSIHALLSFHKNENYISDNDLSFSIHSSENPFVSYDEINIQNLASYISSE